MKHLNAGIFLLFLGLAVCCSQKRDAFSWMEGDILFQDGDCGDFCEAIRKVTQGYQGMDFSHNGLLLKEGEDWLVLEAVSRGVVLTPLDEFLNRHLDANGKPKVMVGRIKENYRHLIPEAISQGRKHLGKPYDYHFDFGNDAFYCSELIHFAFREANDGLDFFTPQPMTYKDPETGELFPIWEKYFENLGVEVPEGEPGLNPGGMSLEEVLEMMALY